MSTIEKEIFDALKEGFGLNKAQIDSLSEETTFESLDFDSLDTLEFAMCCESMIEDDIPDSKIEGWKTIGDALNDLRDMQAKKPVKK